MNTAIFKRKNTGELNNYFIETYLYNGFMKRYFKDFIFFFFFFFYCQTFWRIFQHYLSAILLILSEISNVRRLFSPMFSVKYKNFTGIMYDTVSIASLPRKRDFTFWKRLHIYCSSTLIKTSNKEKHQDWRLMNMAAKNKVTHTKSGTMRTISKQLTHYSEAVTRSSSVNKVFLKIRQNSQQNTCTIFSFLIKKRPAILFKKRLWKWCFPLNFAKFLRTSFFIEHLWVTASDYWIESFLRSVFSIEFLQLFLI